MLCSRTSYCCLLAATIAASGILSAGTARGDNTLRWKFKEGDTLNYVMDRETDMKIDLSGSLIEVKSGMIFDTSWKVKSVDADGTATIEQTVDRIQMKMDSPLGGGLDYDSKKPGSGTGQIWDMMGPMIESLVGGTFTLKATATGQVSDIKLPEKVAEHLAKQQGGGGGGGGGRRGGGGGLGGMMGGLSENSIKEMITRSIVPLPEKPVTPDVKWSQSFAEEMRGAGVKKTEVTYSTSEKTSAEGHEIQKIAAKSDITFEPAEQSQVDIEIEEQEGDMTIYFDVNTGRTVKAEGVQKQVIAITAPNREITQEVEEKVTVREGKSDDGKDGDKDGDK
ncbi:MAG TPA: DUF6263 family protein [Pirellulales bacterium]|nr:DUF6263 family protein [Pirellulales bacterium]